MELYADTADLHAVEAIAQYYPIDGFTTNPKILTRANRPIETMMPEFKAYVEKKNLKIFFQVTAETAEEMFEQAKKLHAYYDRNFIVKIPAVKEGYRAISMCKAADIPVLITAVHSTMQALIAAKAGADYVAPYISHIDNIGVDGVGCVKEMVAAFKNGGYSCKVLGASFRTVDQIKRLAVTGCQAVTVAPEMFDTLIAHASTVQTMENFKSLWTEKFHEAQISDFIPAE